MQNSRNKYQDIKEYSMKMLNCSLSNNLNPKILAFITEKLVILKCYVGEATLLSYIGQYSVGS